MKVALFAFLSWESNPFVKGSSYEYVLTLQHMCSVYRYGSWGWRNARFRHQHQRGCTFAGTHSSGEDKLAWVGEDTDSSDTRIRAEARTSSRGHAGHGRCTTQAQRDVGSSQFTDGGLAHVDLGSSRGGHRGDALRCAGHAFGAGDAGGGVRLVNGVRAAEGVRASDVGDGLLMGHAAGTAGVAEVRAVADVQATAVVVGLDVGGGIRTFAQGQQASSTDQGSTGVATVVAGGTGHGHGKLLVELGWMSGSSTKSFLDGCPQIKQAWKVDFFNISILEDLSKVFSRILI